MTAKTTTAKRKKSPTKQGNRQVGYGKPPKDKRFGEPNGNPRHNGAWKKEDTLRYKWEQILKMTDVELREVIEDPTTGRVEKMTAEVLLDTTMKATEKISVLDRLATQVYGFPKQSVETMEITPPAPRLAKNRDERQ